jgi:hypothetical protein
VLWPGLAPRAKMQFARPSFKSDKILKSQKKGQGKDKVKA